MTLDLQPPDLTLRPQHDLAVPVEPTSTVRLSIGDDALTWGATTIDWDDIIAVRYGTRSEHVSLVHQRRVRRIGMQTVNGVLELCFGRTELGPDARQTQVEAYYAVIDRLHRHVEPRLRERALIVVEGGGRFDVGKVTVVETGILTPSRLVGRRLTTWDQLPAAHFEQARVVLTAGVGNQSAAIGDVSMFEANAVLLPEICIDGITRFS